MAAGELIDPELAAAVVWMHAVALAPPSERFHWLTAPRSDVLQTSPVHEGVCDDAAAALEELFLEFVGDTTLEGADDLTRNF